MPDKRYDSRHKGKVIDDGIILEVNPTDVTESDPLLEGVEMGDGRKFRVGGDPGAAKLIQGYYYNGQFYEDAAHTTPITGEAKNLYIDKETSLIYVYNGTQFIPSAVKYRPGVGIIIDGDAITYDPEVVSSVEYVDANITDTMNFIIQERNAERAAREAGDELLNGRVDGALAKAAQRMALAAENAKYQWNGDKTGHALLTCNETPKVSKLAWVSAEITLSGKTFNSVMVTKVTKDSSGAVISTETRPGGEYMENGTDFSDPTTGEPIGCVVGGDSRMIFVSLPAGTYTTIIGSKEVTFTVPQTGTYLMYDEGADYFIYFSKIDDGSSTPSYIEQSGEDITEETADVLHPFLGIPEVEANPTGTPTAKLAKFKLNGITYALAGAGALVYSNIQTFVTDFNSKVKSDVEVGTIALIRITEVPDLWISANDESTSVPYTYTTDAQFIEDLKTAAETGLQVGYYRVNELEADKVFVPVQDVQINGTTILNNGVANIPVANNATFGVVKPSGNLGVGITSAGILVLNAATDAEIAALTSLYKPIVPANLILAVKTGMLGVIALTDAEKATVRQNIGAVTQVLVSDNL